ncbi:hypothetical protein SAMN05192574_103563 [Mucilaginibacter gossypiicola]|uniref:Uncharacterized protein n=1 Tax=Mucilaginibacter gossypiicola TaxID=551995 RepID=A0A1H8HMD3_9SPHI|nr:hypothetical protein [Mucilaginibacter gossypiicola]SEN57351.1 hypothetical protein SAMN05192574_103563 [Mucilaginibacter gossypiicola]
MESMIETSLKDWREKEQRYEKLFSPAVLKSREFLKEKLKHYDELRAMALSNPIAQDRMALKALNLERKQLARRIYPNVFRRLLDRIISLVNLDKSIDKIRLQNESNVERLRGTMMHSGLGQYFKDVEQQMKQGNREFSLPVSYHVNEHERMQLQLNFKKDETGNYHMDHYKATLHSELDKGKPRQHTFDIGQSASYDSAMAYNLLAGRAVLDQNTGSWKQLDLNDKDGAGNLRMKHFAENYGFDLKAAVTALPLKAEMKENLITKLANGEKVQAGLEVGNKTVPVELSTNPVKKEIAIYNNTGQKVTVDELKGVKARTNVKQLIPESRETKQVKGKSVKL